VGEQLVCKCGSKLFHVAPDLVHSDGSRWPMVTCAVCGRLHLAEKEADHAEH